MADEKDPYLAPLSDISPTISSLDDITDYISLHADKSLLCSFLINLAHEDTQAMVYFLRKSLDNIESDTPVDLETYQLATAYEKNGLKRKDAPDQTISEADIFKKSCKQRHSTMMDRRQFVGLATAFAAGWTSISAGKSTINSLSDAQKEAPGSPERGQYNISASIFAGLTTVSAIIAGIGLWHMRPGDKEQKLKELADNPEVTTATFDAFREKCDAQLLTIARSAALDEQGGGMTI